MSTVRRFLVIQALRVWQGGFLFYAAVVVPVGTRLNGGFAQGTVTRHVTDWLNGLGALALVVLAWDQWANGDRRGLRVVRCGLWLVLGGTLAGLALVHSHIEPYLDSVMDYDAFYRWHRVYLGVAAAQWTAGLAYVAVLVRAWATVRPDRLESCPTKGPP